MAQGNIQHDREPWTGHDHLERRLVLGYVGTLTGFIEQLDRITEKTETEIERARRLV